MAAGGNHSDRSPTGRTPSGSELMGLGIAIAVSVLVPMLLGFGVDALLHTSPVGILVGLLAGIGAACYVVISRFRRYA